MANLFVKQEALGLEIKQNVKFPAFFVANLKNRVKLLIGLGSPYEEPLALEAISHGCIVINPKVRNFDLPLACEQAVLFGREKGVSSLLDPSLARSREAHFAYPKRRACSQANLPLSFFASCFSGSSFS